MMKLVITRQKVILSTHSWKFQEGLQVWVKQVNKYPMFSKRLENIWQALTIFGNIWQAMGRKWQANGKI